ncbi:MAG: hypothetical protein M1438_04845 [Deltaproteobacteria bacterium]|nr:hypothetical protein [Deltaproteobacteria bacterium]
MKNGCQWQNHNPVTGEPLDCGGGQPQCRLCRHWRPKEREMVPKGDGRRMKPIRNDLRRRCARHEKFYSLPHYGCRAFESSKESICRKTG